MKILYNLFIKLYPIAAKLLSNKNAKAKLWVNGRKDIFNKLQSAFANNEAKVIWMHCASLGEFEQGRPVLEGLKEQNPKYKILLTFFSPSGYEVHKHFAGANWVFYLPMDSQENAQKFYNTVNPKLILFVKYDYWLYYLQEAKNRNIPLLLIAGIFRKDQPFFKWYGSLHMQMLDCFTHIFTQNEGGKYLLQSIDFHENVTVTGDTRFDRVVTIAQQPSPIDSIENFLQNYNCIVAGSTWPEDDLELAHYINANEKIKCIIAPHDINNERLNQCLSIYKNAVLWSKFNKNITAYTNTQCIIIDNIGMLSKLYKYATICYVGGGFGNDGVHNVLEAAVYSKPVIFGPEYEKYIEAIDLINEGGAYSIDSALTLEECINKLLQDSVLYAKTSSIAGNYVQQQAGATQKTINWIVKQKLL